MMYQSPALTLMHEAVMCNNTSFLLLYRNAAPALRIKQSALVEEPDPLDDTRIHPQYYTLAVSLCNKALEGSKHTVDDDDDQLIVEQAMRKHPDRILALDLVVGLYKP